LIKNLKIDLYKTNDDAEAEKTVTIPFSSLHAAVQLIPKVIKVLLEKEGIDISQCKEIVDEKDLKGTIIEIEHPRKKLVISVE